MADIQHVDLATDFQAGMGELRNALEPIFKGTLDSIINDPHLTTREKIVAFIKAYAAHKDPIEARLEEKIRELDSAIASHEVQITSLKRERKGLYDRKASKKAIERVEKDLWDLERKKLDLEQERRSLQRERIDLHMKHYEKLIKTADALHERYGRIVDELLKKVES